MIFFVFRYKYYYTYYLLFNPLLGKKRMDSDIFAKVFPTGIIRNSVFKRSHSGPLSITPAAHPPKSLTSHLVLTEG